MMIQLPRTSTEQEYSELMLRQNKILNNMLGADIDFIVRGIDSKTFSVVASRREACSVNASCFIWIPTLPAHIVFMKDVSYSHDQCRCGKSYPCGNFRRGNLNYGPRPGLGLDWRCPRRFSVGDEVLVRVQKVRRESLEDISIRVDVKAFPRIPARITCRNAVSRASIWVR